MDHENYLAKCRTCSVCDALHFDVETPCTATQNTRCKCSGGLTCKAEHRYENSCDYCTKITQCGPGQGVQKKATPWEDTICQPCPSGKFSTVTDATSDCLPHTRCPTLGLITKIPGTNVTDTVCAHPPPPGFSLGIWCLLVGVPAAITTIIIIILMIVLLARRKRSENKGLRDLVRVQRTWSKENNSPSEKTELTEEFPTPNWALELPPTTQTTCGPTSHLLGGDGVERWCSTGALEKPPEGRSWKTSDCSLCQREQESLKPSARYQGSNSTLGYENSENGNTPTNKKREMGNLSSSGFLLLGISQAQLAMLPMDGPPAPGCEMETRQQVLMCDLIATDLGEEKIRGAAASGDTEESKIQVKGPPEEDAPTSADTSSKAHRLPPRLKPPPLNMPRPLSGEAGCRDEINDSSNLLETDGICQSLPVTVATPERSHGNSTLRIQSSLSENDLPRELRSTGRLEMNPKDRSRSSQQPEEDEWTD